MLDKKEKAFIAYWEANRDRLGRWDRQLLLGMPVGLLFALPILLNFLSGWYQRADMEARSQEFSPAVLLLGVFLIAGFTAVFYKRYRWDRNEQRYRALLLRQQEEERGKEND
jgi:hypothetical protein